MTDDFQDIAEPEASESDLEDLAVYAFRFGEFGRPSKDGPGFRTLLTTARVGDAIVDLSTFEETVLRQNARWPASQVIQREIDEDRVREIAQRYLRTKGNLKYFPPLTVVLLPRSATENTVAMNYEESGKLTTAEKNALLNRIAQHLGFSDPNKIKNLFDANSDNINRPVSGLYIVPLAPNSNFHFILWDRTKLYAIVIDGQHRLKALESASAHDTDIRNYRQDIVFIDVPERAKQTGESPTKIVRQIFVDVNSNAVPVSIVKRYIMDDKDLASLLLQAIVDDSDETNLTEGRCLKPQVVDWHSLNLKHELPHMTSILVLYQLLSDYVVRHPISSVQSLRNSKSIKNWVDRLNDRFLVDTRIAGLQKYTGIRPLKDHLDSYLKLTDADTASGDEEEAEESAIFEYDYGSLKVAQDAFREIYAPAIVSFFVDLQPYKTVDRWLDENGAFNPENTLYHSLIKMPAKRIETERDVAKSASENAKAAYLPKYGLFYTVLGQKALFRLFMEHVDKEVQKPEEDAVSTTAKDFIERANRWIIALCREEPNLFSFDSTRGTSVLPKVPSSHLKRFQVQQYKEIGSSFWEGIIYRDQSIIYNSRGIRSLSQFFQLLFEFEKNDEDGRGEILDSLSNKLIELPYHLTNIKKRISESNEGLNDGEVDSIARHIIDAKASYLAQLLADAKDLI